MESVYHTEQQSKKAVNPWKTIWFAPRLAIRSVIENKTITFAMLLAVLVGITNFIDRAIGQNLGDKMAMPAILLFSIVGGAIAGVIGWWIISGIMLFVGKWFGGKATYKEMQMAIGAAYIPSALTVILYILDFLFLGERLFSDIQISVLQMIWILLSSFVTMILAVWTIFLTIKAIAEAHRFSSWRGLLTFMIPAAAVIIILIILALILLFL